jgi:GT2 family glycosyltransferase
VTSRLTISAVVPAYNAEATLEEALNALCAILRCGDELIVFDDGSIDATATIAARSGARVLRNDGTPLGPAHGRNLAAAAATGELLFFVDADVVVAPGSLDLLMRAMLDGEAAAAFGSYDDRPRSSRLSSLYINLRHHFIHQRGSRDATTFWAGIGLIERRVFESLGGFDELRFARSSIEDIELGLRMTAAGHRILLVPEAQGTHLKDWTVRQVWMTDIFRRAVPWSRLIAEGQVSAADLNIGPGERVNAALALAMIPAAALSLLWPQLAVLPVVMLAGYITRNRRFFGFLARRLPFKAFVTAMSMHWCYHVYASATFALVAGSDSVSRRLSGAPAQPTL